MTDRKTEQGQEAWSKEYPSLKNGGLFWLRDSPTATPRLTELNGGYSFYEPLGVVCETTEYLGPVTPEDAERIAPSVADAIQKVREMQRDWEREARNSPWWQRYVDAATYIIGALESLAPPESTRVAGEQVTVSALVQLLNAALLHPESAEGYIRRVIEELSITTPSDSARRAAEEIHKLCDGLAPDIPDDPTLYAPTVRQIAAIISKHAAIPAADDAGRLLSNIHEIADIGSAEESGDALERLKSIRELIDNTTKGAR